MDILLDYDTVKDFVKKVGMKSLIELAESDYNYKFHSCSEDWLNDPKQACVIKGAKGTIIIGWIGIRD